MNDLKTKVMKLGQDLLSTETVVKELGLQLRCIGERKSMLSAENGILPVAKQEMICLPISRLRPKPSSKATKKLRENIEEQYIGLAIHMNPSSVHGV